MPATSEHEARASSLAIKSLEYLKAGSHDDAIRSLREALSLAPRNETVLHAFHDFQKDQNVPPVSRLCQKLVVESSPDAGKEVLRALKDPNLSLQPSTATECLQLLLAHANTMPSPEGGEVVGGILKASRGGREYLTDLLERDAVQVLNEFTGLGGAAIDGLVVVLLDPMAWKVVERKNKCLRECFKAFLENLKLREKEKKLATVRSVARLLTAHADELHSFVGQEALERFLEMLDTNLAEDLRSHATLATAKFVEADETVAASMLGRFMLSRLTEDSDDDLRIAFSAAAAIFPLVPTVAAQLFMTDGFVEGIVPSLQGRPGDVEKAALEMMNAACVDKNCRAAVAGQCEGYLEAVSKSAEGTGKAIASTILAKVRFGVGEPGTLPKGIDELATVFKNMILQEDADSRYSSVEGLAYVTLKASVKQSLCKDTLFVKNLLETIKDTSSKPTVMFGGLTVINNLTSYLPSLSEEQKKVAQLKDYANATPKAKTEPDIGDKDPAVTERCKILLEAGIIPVLIACSRKISQNAIAIVTNIFLSLSQHQKHRGLIAQQGGVKLLLQFYSAVTGDTSHDRRIKQACSHALSRVLVSTNPSHVFSSQLPVASAVRPLLALLDDSDDQPTLLPVFEALLALTNLASTDNSTRDIIIRIGWQKIEETMLSSNAMVQRATVELVCNLMASPDGVEKFADGSKSAGNRLHILLALADSEDLATRRAAGGALAMLTEWDKACEAIMNRERGVEILLTMVSEDNEEVRHRGVVCIRNLVCGGGEYIGKFKAAEGVNIIREALRGTRNPEVLSVGVEALKVLMQE
ncbi:armadillo-type protein [Morchella snyderi]|nr:armadillo-type protein [Morchella snyderi]